MSGSQHTWWRFSPWLTPSLVSVSSKCVTLCSTCWNTNTAILEGAEGPLQRTIQFTAPPWLWDTHTHPYSLTNTPRHPADEWNHFFHIFSHCFPSPGLFFPHTLKKRITHASTKHSLYVGAAGNELLNLSGFISSLFSLLKDKFTLDLWMIAPLLILGRFLLLFLLVFLAFLS